MKRLGLIMAVLTLAATCSLAEGFKIGAHGAYAAEGDINDETIGYGAQIAAEVNSMLSLELSGTTWTEERENKELDLEVSTIALTVRIGGDVAENVHLYVGAGGNYNIFDEIAEEVDDSLGFHVGGGIELLLATHLELFVEYRHSFVEIDEEDEEGGYTFGGDDRFEFGLLRAGFSLVL